ncbi:hypothetical protein BU332_22695 [Salmonella enterica]|nr:hypothetical protein [Salmonella enterica]EBR1292726.1 hypothetical protein [Salmonella enterica]
MTIATIRAYTAEEIYNNARDANEAARLAEGAAGKYEQDWCSEATAWTFADGSRLVVCEEEIRAETDADARALIESIADDLERGYSEHTELDRIKSALEDGEALAGMGLPDGSRWLVEDAWSIVCDWIEKGFETYGQAIEA